MSFSIFKITNRTHTYTPLYSNNKTKTKNMKPSLLVEALKKKLPGASKKDEKNNKIDESKGTKEEKEVIERKSRSASKISNASGKRSRTNSMNYALGGI